MFSYHKRLFKMLFCLGWTRAEADMPWKQLTNRNRSDQLANQSRQGFIRRRVLKRQKLNPGVSDRGWKEELQQRTVWGLFLNITACEPFQVITLIKIINLKMTSACICSFLLHPAAWTSFVLCLSLTRPHATETNVEKSPTWSSSSGWIFSIVFRTNEKVGCRSQQIECVWPIRACDSELWGGGAERSPSVTQLHTDLSVST